MELFAPAHLAIIFLIALLVFGPQRLPQLGRSLGEGIREFKNAFKEASSDSDKKEITAPDKK